MKILPRYAMALLASLAGVAPVAAKDCEREANMAAIRYCMGEVLDQKLAAAYTDTLNFVRSKDAQAADLLAAAQKSWETFASDSCAYTVAARQTERLANDARMICRATFVDARIKVLQAYRREFGRPE